MATATKKQQEATRNAAQSWLEAAQRKVQEAANGAGCEMAAGKAYQEAELKLEDAEAALAAGNAKRAAAAAKRAANKAAKAEKAAAEKAAAEQAEADEDQPKSNLASTISKYRAAYVPTLAASGKKSLSNGDELALWLAGREADEVMAIAEIALGFAEGELALKYAHLNKGQQRMNAGNRLRAAGKRGELAFVEAEDGTKSLVGTKKA